MEAVLALFTIKEESAMIQLEASLKVLDGLLKDPNTGDYRVLQGYAHQTLRYPMTETWLDEDDNLWVSAKAVEREIQKERFGEAKREA